MQQEIKPEIRFYKVTGMSCAACSSRVEKTVAGLQGVDSCTVNLLTGDLLVQGTADESAVIDSVEKIGYGCKSREKDKSQETHTQRNSNTVNEQKQIIIRLILSVLLLIPLMIISMTAAGFVKNGAVDHTYRPLLTAVFEFMISSIILLINRRFFISGMKAVLHGSPNMDTLISLGSGISWIWSVYIFVRMCTFLSLSCSMEDAWGEASVLLGQLYFESAAMIPTIITVGKLLESYSKGKTTDAVNSLKKLRPQKAHKITDTGESLVDAEELKPGDHFSLRPGDAVPADGRVIKGESLIDESMLSGESRPVEKTACFPGLPEGRNNHVYAATINKTGFLLCECEKNGNDTIFAQIIRMVTDASATKAPVARMADKAAAFFVPAVLIISTVTFIVWILMGETLSGSLQRAVSVLVISCPCALGLATPVAIMCGCGVGARNGILFKTAESLEMTGKMEMAVLDKTGTLTTGSPRVCGVLPASGINENEFLKMACSLESASEHPLAKAVIDYTGSKGILPDPIRAFRADGSCITGEYHEHRMTAGSRRSILREVMNETLLSDFDKEAVKRTETGQTPIYFVLDDQLIGMIFCEDSIRDNAKQSTGALKQLGLNTLLLSGDDYRTANSVAERTGIQKAIAGVMPAEKAEWVRKLKSKGKVLMVGDGINDAPALAAADIGMAVASGTDVAMDAADVVLMKSDLMDIAAAVRLSRETLKTIKQNLFWAVFYNILCIPAAAGMLKRPFGISVSPMLGAAAMSISSLFVVLNALRLNRLQLYPDKTREEMKINMEKTLNIKGMMCPHCEARVKLALEKLQNVESADVSFEKGTAVIKGSASLDELVKAVTEAGYEVV